MSEDKCSNLINDTIDELLVSKQIDIEFKIKNKVNAIISNYIEDIIKTQISKNLNIEIKNND